MKWLTMLVVAVAFSTAVPARGAEAKLPPSEAGARERLDTSPRHGEWVDMSMGEGKTAIRSYVVYPERKEKAPVVIVIQEIYGLTPWIRSVADQLAADGFIAIAPDLLSGHGPKGGGTDEFASRDDVTRAVRALKPADVKAALDAVRDYGVKLPAANGKYATVGFCWGGGVSFTYATQDPNLSAAVVYYGTSPQDGFDKVSAPVLGLYGGDDARVNATIEPAKAKMEAAGKTYEPVIYDGAGHGFLRQQEGRNGANMKAATAAWPKTVEFINKHAN